MNFHNSQEQKYVEALVTGSTEWGKPVLVASELGAADPYNSGMAALRKQQWLCHLTGSSAVASLANLYKYSRYLEIA